MKYLSHSLPAFCIDSAEFRHDRTEASSGWGCVGGILGFLFYILIWIERGGGGGGSEECGISGAFSLYWGPQGQTLFYARHGGYRTRFPC